MIGNVQGPGGSSETPQDDLYAEVTPIRQPGTLEFEKITNGQDISITPDQEEASEHASLSAEEAEVQKAGDMLLYLVTSSGDSVEVSAPPENLKNAILEARRAVKKHLNHSDLTFKNIDFKYLTCEAVNQKGDTRTVNIPLMDELSKVRSLLVEYKFMPPNNWPKMEPSEVSFQGSGMHVIGRLEGLHKKVNKVLSYLRISKGEEAQGEDIQAFLESQENISFPDVKQKIPQIKLKIKARRKKLKENIERLNQEIEEKKKEITLKPSTSLEKEKNDNLNEDISRLQRDIKKNRDQLRAYKELQTQPFALNWALYFRHSQLDGRPLAEQPLANARKSFKLLKEFIKKYGSAFVRNNPKKINAYCAQVSAMLTRTRAQRIQFLRECSQKYPVDLEEISLDETILKEIMGDDQSEPAALETPPPSDNDLQAQIARRDGIQITPQPPPES